jgi:hypothetical protein
MEEDSLPEVIRGALEEIPLPPPGVNEQTDLQPQVQAALEKAFNRTFPQRPLHITTSIGGAAKPNLRLLGTSFWPDVEIAEGDTLLAAIEVKIVRPRQTPSKAIAEALGQSLVYSIRYHWVFAFVVHHGRSDDRHHSEDARLARRLLPLNIQLVLRRP